MSEENAHTPVKYSFLAVWDPKSKWLVFIPVPTRQSWAKYAENETIRSAQTMIVVKIKVDQNETNDFALRCQPIANLHAP